MVFARPRHYSLAIALYTTRHHLCARQHLHIVVQLLALRGPCLHAFRYERHIVFKSYLNWLLRPMPSGLQADVFKPLRIGVGEFHFRTEIAKPIRVHCTMKIHARNTLLVWRQNARDYFRIVDARRALIVNHNIVALRVIRVAINRQRGLRAFIRRMCVVDNNVDAPLQPCLQDVLLLHVIVTTTAGNQQRPYRFRQRLFSCRKNFPDTKAGQY